MSDRVRNEHARAIRAARTCVTWALLALAAAAPARAQAPANTLASAAAADTLASAAAADTLGSRAAADTLGSRAAADTLAVTGAADSLARGGAALADSLARAAARAMARAGATVRGDTVRRDVDFLWVLRTSLVDPADVPRIVERARAMGVRGLLVQVVGRGDAWYRSDLLPPPEALRDPARDPLGELLPLAHAAGLEVQAWMNCCLVWSGPHPPTDARHVLRSHPEWVARMKDGRPMTRLSEAARERLMVEGVFLSPGHPGVRHWLASVAAELVRRYPVDGLHLDYIRQPSIGIGFDPTTRARFALENGADPDPAAPAAPFHRLPPAERAAMDSAWARFQTDQVTAIVREVRDSVESVRPGLPLTAAVLADSLTAVQRNHQAWHEWLREGLLDRAFAMCYAPGVQTVLGQLADISARAGAARVVPGIAIYNTGLSTAAAKIKGARALGFSEVSLYSYDSLWERDDRWARLRAFLNGPSTLEEQP